jgi:hypothetical protein
MDSVHRHVVGDEVAVFDQVVVVDVRCRPEIVGDGCEDQLPTFTTLRACGVVDHVWRDEFVDDGVVTRAPSSKELFDDVLR